MANPELINYEPAAGAAISPATPEAEATIRRPFGMYAFEAFAYAGIALSVVGIALRYSGPAAFPTETVRALIALLPVLAQFALAFSAWGIAHGRMRGVRTLFGIAAVFGLPWLFSPFFFPPTTYAWLAMLAVPFTFLAFFLLGLPSVGNWYERTRAKPETQSVPGIWATAIPGMNWFTFALSLGFLLCIDLRVLLGDWTLLLYFVEMVLVLAAFTLFLLAENVIFRKYYGYAPAGSDALIAILIALRNLAVILNSIPFIQLLGGAALLFGILPFLVIYISILVIRRKATPSA